MIKPKKLQPGDRVAAVSLSWGGPGTFPQRYAAGTRQLAETFGLEVVATRHALRPADWLAAHPQARAADLMEAFADPAIAGIISTIGGDDSIRILPFLDLDLIRHHPKVLLGYSDTTVTHLACHKAGLGTFYGPAILAGFGENGGLFPYMVAAVRKTLFSTAPPGRLAANPDGWTVEHLDWGVPELQQRRRVLQPPTGWRWLQGRGSTEGPLLGGCLEVLDWLRGSPVWPDTAAWEGAILFFETSEEAPSPTAVHRMLRNLAAVGVLDRIAGILVGRPGGNVPVAHFADYDAAILAVVRTELGLIDLPIVTGLDFGHTDPMLVLPYGARVRLDCVRREIHLLDSGVTD